MSLTSRQKDVLAAIRIFQERKGYTPSYRELAMLLGITSTNSIAWHIRNLEEAGYVIRDPGRARSIQIVVSETTDRKWGFALDDVRAEVAAMRERYDRRRQLSRSDCRLSLPMSEFLLALIDDQKGGRP